MKVLLLTSARPASLLPLVGVAQHLRAQGHTVAWLALPRAPPHLSRLEMELLHLPEGAALPEPVGELSERSILLRNPEGWRTWLQSVLLDGVPLLVAPLRQLLRELRPDVLGLDPTVYPGAIAAELEDLPYACISTSLQPLTPEDDPGALSRMVKSLASARAALFATYGLAPRFAQTELLAPTFTSVFADAALVGPAPLPPGVELVGPSRPAAPRGDAPPFRFEALTADFAYLSLGTLGGWQPKIFERVAQVCARRALPLVLSAGLSPRAKGLEALPGQVQVVEYAPQLELLRRARVFISAGGPVSVMEALDAGVPMLVQPLGHDQPLVAARAEEAGVAQVMNLEHASLADIDHALGLLLDPQGRALHRVRQVAAAYQARDGAREVARRLVALRG